MSTRRFSRRKILGTAALNAAFGAAGIGVVAGTKASEQGGGTRTGAGLNVRDFGAVGDGKTDDTEAFRSALKAAGDAGGDVVFVPRGNYLIGGTLE
ncbi:MAG TPA: glycosyl hydrolase family 28-related protein, partial [Verrucomicrobiota bacterium]|nr:glycosyl hydrolase family 28-related protein [Verrucomicrobiota bacterium]